MSMIMWSWPLPLVALILLSIGACSLKPTQYKEKSVFSYEGFTEEKNGEGVYRVTFTGVGHETPETVEDLLDRRCAEITRREGYEWFSYYTKSRNDNVGIGSGRKSVPSFYGVIHLKRGPIDAEGVSAQEILARPLPQGVEQ